MALQGACLCGLIRYEIAGPLQHAHHCHCGRCRKHHGSSYVSYAFWPLEGFRYLAGEDRIRRFDSSAASASRDTGTPWHRTPGQVCARCK